MISNKKIEEEAKPSLNQDNQIRIDSFRYTKISRDNASEFKKAETDFFPFNSVSHDVAKADEHGIYHQQYQFTIPIKHWRFYVQIGYSTGAIRPSKESFGESHGDMTKISIDGVEFLEFLKQYKHTAKNEVIANIDSFIMEHNRANKSLAKVKKDRVFLSCLYAPPKMDRSVNYVDKIEVDQKSEEAVKRFIGLEKYRISSQDPMPRASGWVAFGHFEDISKPEIISFKCVKKNKDSIDDPDLSDFNMNQPGLDGPAIIRNKLQNGDNLFLIEVIFKGASFKDVTLDLGNDRTISALAINNHDLYDLLKKNPSKTPDMQIFLDNYSPKAFKQLESDSPRFCPR